MPRHGSASPIGGDTIIYRARGTRVGILTGLGIWRRRASATDPDSCTGRWAPITQARLHGARRCVATNVQQRGRVQPHVTTTTLRGFGRGQPLTGPVAKWNHTRL